MLVDGCQRPLDDTWCSFCAVFTSWWVFAVTWVIVVVCYCCLRLLVSQQMFISSLMLPMGPSVSKSCIATSYRIYKTSLGCSEEPNTIAGTRSPALARL